MDATWGIEPGTIPMHTDRLTLRKFVPSDADDVFEYQSRSDVALHLYRLPLSRSECNERVTRMSAFQQWENDGDSITLAVCAQDSSRVIGEIVLKLADARARQIEIGWVVNPRFWGQGFAGEAARRALEFSFNELRAHRVFARLATENAASAKVCTRIGMRLEAHLRENDITPVGEWGSEYVYAALHADLASSPRLPNR